MAKMFVTPYLKWKSEIIPFTKVEWSGTDTQASREINFELPWNPYDKEAMRLTIKKGDVIELWFKGQKKAAFVGTITTRTKTDAIGTCSYTAKDFLHHLINSTGTYIFKNTTPEAITRKVCKDAGVPVGKLATTGITIKKMIFEDASLYDIIVKAYRKVKAETGKNYMPCMDGTKVAVIEKGNSSEVTLTQKVNITSASFTDTVDNMVNRVRIYDEKHKKVGEVSNDKQLSTYGVYQQTYTKEEGKNAKVAAKSMLFGVTREASIEALGDIRALSGYSIKIHDKATKLDGVFYITSDTHTFENNTHIMSLGLSWKESMEQGADTVKPEKKKKKKKETSNIQTTVPTPSTYTQATANLANTYLDNSKSTPTKTTNDKIPVYYVTGRRVGPYNELKTVYHSTKSCPILKLEKKENCTNNVITSNNKRVKKVTTSLGSHLNHCSTCWKGNEYTGLAARTQKEIKEYLDSKNTGSSIPYE